MAVAATLLAMSREDHAALHPFFAASKLPQDHPEASNPPSLSSDHEQLLDRPAEEAEAAVAAPEKMQKEQGARKRRPRESKAAKQAQRGFMEAFTRGGSAAPQAHVNGGDASDAASAQGNTVSGSGTDLDLDPNLERRKRRKTDSPHGQKGAPPAKNAGGTLEKQLGNCGNDESPLKHDHPPPAPQGSAEFAWHEQLEAEASKHGENVQVEASNPYTARQDQPVQTTPLKETLPSSPPAITQTPTKPNLQASAPISTSASLPPAEPPRKMLRLNAKGKFSSPPSKDVKASVDITEPKRRVGRPKKASKRPREHLVTLQYGADVESRQTIGKKIGDILSGALRWKPAVTAVSAPREKAAHVGPSKETHPFFLGKPAVKEDSKQALQVLEETRPKHASPRKTGVTPGKLRAQAMAHLQQVDPVPTLAHQQYSRRPSGLHKHPGSHDAAWPWQGVQHVRAVAENELVRAVGHVVAEITGWQNKKQKHKLVGVLPSEDIILKLSKQLFHLPHSNEHWLRLPQRLLTTGEDIQDLVRQQLRCSDISADSILASMCFSIRHTLTPFDLGKCEQQPWTQKYAPQRSNQVLQTGKEVSVLRDWLKSLTVTSVDGGGQPSKVANEKTKKRKKRKRKTTDLDDFIVSGDEDVASLDELTDPEDDPSFSRQGQKRSLVRGSGAVAGTKLGNVVLLSGPHGCGKTASVYAIAKELDFEIFEINAGSRRSGKDIMDKVGDMAENHLVQQQVAKELDMMLETLPSSQTSEVDNTQQEVDSGRQGTMTSFFQTTMKSTPVAKPKPKIPKKDTKNPPLKKSSNQKQSLILLEEVDVLFEEDQGFWATIRALAEHSRRPIIMTCNDENLVRIEEEALYAILRFNPAPIDLATDYLLLLAASEGHVLARRPVSELYESRGQDLRATITELNFWCQMAIGDRKGGLEWMYQRWPPGKDVDDRGRTLRVASKDTYARGMGWLGHDVLAEAAHVGFDREAEILQEAWEWWDVKPETWCASNPAGPERKNVNDSSAQVDTRLENLRRLQGCESQTYALSSMDMYSRTSLSFDVNIASDGPMDTTLPQLSERKKQNFVEGYSLLSAEPIFDFTNTSAKLACRTALQISEGLDCCLSARSESDRCDFSEDAVDNHILSSLRAQRIAPFPTPTTILSALEPLAAVTTSSLFSANPLPGTLLTSLDRPTSIVITEIAPYIRGIAAYDQRLEAERLRLSSLLSVTGGRMRKTRAARSALEGGRRETTRRERWFAGSAALNLVAVTETGGEWAEPGATAVDESVDGQTATGSVSVVGSATASQVEDAEE